MKKLLAAALFLTFLPSVADSNMVMAPTSGGGGGAIAYVRNFNSADCHGATTCNISVTTSTAGNFINIGIETGNSTPGITISSVTGITCSAVAGATNNVTSSVNTVITMYQCPNIPGGSATLTVTASGAPSSYFAASTYEFSGVSTSTPLVASSGNSASDASGSNSNQSVTAGAATTQANQLTMSYNANTTGTVTSVGGGQTSVLTDLAAATYQLVNSSGATPTHSFNFSGGAETVSVIAIFSHP